MIKAAVCTWISALMILFLTGLILPSLVSTDHLPLWLIIIITAAIFCIVPILIILLLNALTTTTRRTKNGRSSRSKKR